MKSPRLAKSRLRGVLDAAERARLATQLFERTLRLLVGMHGEDVAPTFDVAVVTADAGVVRRAAAHGVGVIDERGTAGLSAAVREAAAAARAGGYGRMCVLPADLAVPDPDDIRRLLAQDLGEPGVALCPSRDFGTNALLAAPPDAIDFAYGPRSFHAHRDNAAAAGIVPVVLPLESLRWDVDGPGDLSELFDAVPGVFGPEGGR